MRKKKKYSILTELFAADKDISRPYGKGNYTVLP